MVEVRTQTIVDVEWLADRLRAESPMAVVVEVTNDESHVGGPGVIPGSRTVYWKTLLWHDARRELATAETLARRLQALGAGSDTDVVVAGEPTQFAAYAIWAATVVGLADRLHYLDGGIGAWRAAEVSIPPRAPAPAATTSQTPSATRPSALIDRAGVLDSITSPRAAIVDLRSPEEYAGHRVSPSTEVIDHGAQRHGRIPGAQALHVAELLDSQGRVLPLDRLHERVRSVDLDNADDLIFYCRLSHRAALGWLIFRDVLDDDRVRVYDGSWTEWGSVVGAPVEL